MLKDLKKVANKLDSVGLTKEADTIDALIEKIAFSEDESFNMEPEGFEVKPMTGDYDSFENNIKELFDSCKSEY